MVNQVKSFRLAHIFETVSPSNVQTFYTKPTQKDADTQVEVTNLLW